MRLAELIQTQSERIASEWASWARREVASAARLSTPDLLDHFPELLADLATTLRRAQHGEEDGGDYSKETQHHAQNRVEHGFQLREVVHEYRVLRRVLFRHVAAIEAWPGLVDDLARMNECLDFAAAEAVDRFSRLREDRQRADVEETAAFRERFIAIVSHDLRNPVNAIAMSAQMILRAEDIPPSIGHLAGRILVGTERMTRMISDLLDLTRGRLGGGIPIEPKPTHLPAIAQMVIENLSAMRPERKIVSRWRGALDGVWDPDRIAQLFSNLLGNALDHGDPASSVQVDGEGAGDEVVITVRNRGEPIPADELPHIFEAFRRVRGARSPSGLGLGLFIASEIVRAHEGRIAVTSTAAEGTTFTITLPRRVSKSG